MITQGLVSKLELNQEDVKVLIVCINQDPTFVDLECIAGFETVKSDYSNVISCFVVSNSSSKDQHKLAENSFTCKFGRSRI